MARVFGKILRKMKCVISATDTMKIAACELKSSIKIMSKYISKIYLHVLAIVRLVINH